MAHPHWPLFELAAHTPRLSVRYLTDELGSELATLAAGGIHEPDTMPFLYPWTDAASPDLERNALRFYWRTRAETLPASWSLQFAVLVGDVVIGSTNLIGAGFPAARTFETGSWLGRAHQGRGFGTEMRVATLHLGFLALDALTATTAAFHDNAASLGVTRKLGYEPNGIAYFERRGERAQIQRYRMEREHFLSAVRRDDVEIEGDAGARHLLGVNRPGE